MKNSIRKVFCGLVMLLLIFTVNGQPPVTVVGKITDGLSNPIANVSIHLLNTQLTTSSKKEGHFAMQNVVAGKYTIELSAVGYATLARSIDVTAKDTAMLLFQLQDLLVNLEAVTVTAQKREELLQNIPVSVTAFSARQVEEFRLWNAKEITAIVPNLYSGNSGDERNVTSIRGITTTSYDPSVATYIDGVNQFNLDTYIPQLSDVERIEVLRGPQGTLYGRNAMGGVINIITKQPTNNTTGFVEVNIGNYSQLRYSAGIRTPVIKDKLFFGASGVFAKRDGYYSNGFNNTSFDRQQGITGNYYLKYRPGAKWALTVNAKHQNNRNQGAFPLVNGVDEAFQSPFQLTQNAVGKMIDNTFNASLSIAYTGTSVTATSQTAWQSNHRYYKAPVDGDFSPLDAVTISNDYGKQWNNVKVVTQEFRLNSSPTKSSLFNWTAGTYFFHQYNPVKSATNFGKDAGMLGVPDTDFSILNTTKGRNTGIAAYGQMDYRLTKKLALIAGLRYDYENKKLAVKGEYQKLGTAAIVTRPDTSASENFSALSPKLGLKYEIAGNSNLFLSYSRGYRTGGLTQLSADPSQPPLFPYQPEYSNNMEVGVKNNFFANRLRLNVTAFLTYVNDAQVPTLILPDAITVTRNTGKLRSKGAELELWAKPVKGLQLQYSFGYTDAKYKSLKLSQNGQAVNLDGKKQIFTPDVTSLLALQYSYMLSTKHQLKAVARGEWFYLGERYFDLDNKIRQSPYDLLNTRIGVSSKHVDVFFWIRNLTGKTYIEYAYDFGGVHLGNPKTYGITAIVRNG